MTWCFMHIGKLVQHQIYWNIELTPIMHLCSSIKKFHWIWFLVNWCCITFWWFYCFTMPYLCFYQVPSIGPPQTSSDSSLLSSGQKQKITRFSDAVMVIVKHKRRKTRESQVSKIKQELDEDQQKPTPKADKKLEYVILKAYRKTNQLQMFLHAVRV